MTSKNFSNSQLQHLKAKTSPIYGNVHKKLATKMEKKSLLQNLEKKMEKNFDEGVARGMDLGREEGYTIAKEAFDKMINVVKAREAPKVNTSEAGTQTDTPHTTTTSISVQVNTTTLPTTSQAWKFVENGVGTCLAPTVAVTTQMDPTHSWKPPILQDAELMQNVMQDHKNLHLAE
jgi:hypothetical protein